MKKTRLFAMMTVILAMGLAACGGNGGSNEPSKEPSADPTSQPSADPTSQPDSSGQSPDQSSGQSSAQSSDPGSSSSSQAPAQQGEFAANAIDIIEESNKAYAKISGTISGFESADAMKMAFGLKAENADTYIFGSATPADADYKLVPTVDATAGTFELKADLSEVTWVGGTYTAMVGPKGFYKAVASSGGTYGTGKSVMNGFRISIRSHNGTVAADELPPVELTISRMLVEGDHIYHILGGALNTAKLSQEAFLAKHPYVCYETTVAQQWKQNVLGSSTKTDLVTVSVDAQGNALIKTDVTSLPADNYNVKLNLNADSPTDTKMDAIIDETDNPTAFGMYDYIPYADSTQSDKAHIYGNCGLIIKAANRYVPYGDKIADLQPVRSKEGEIAYEMVAADCVGQNAPKYGSSTSDKDTRLGKNNKFTDVWEINGIQSGEYEVYVKGAYSSDAYWSGALQVANTTDTETGTQNGDPYNPAARYNFKVDSGTAVDCLSEKKYSEDGLTKDADGGWTTSAMAKIMIAKGSASFTMKNENNGYSIWVFAIRLVRVGDYNGPIPALQFTDGRARIEAEDYDANSNNASFNVVASEGASGGKYLGGFDQYGEEAHFNIALAAEMNVRFEIRYSCHTDPNGYGAVEFYVDGTKINNFGSLEATATVDAPVWATAEVPVQALTSGSHKLTIRTPWQASSNFDYIELIQVTE